MYGLSQPRQGETTGFESRRATLPQLPGDLMAAWWSAAIVKCGRSGMAKAAFPPLRRVWTMHRRQAASLNSKKARKTASVGATAVQAATLSRSGEGNLRPGFAPGLFFLRHTYTAKPRTGGSAPDANAWLQHPLQPLRRPRQERRFPFRPFLRFPRLNHFLRPRLGLPPVGPLPHE